MSKFREAMRAGQLAYRGPGNRSQVPFYCTLAGVFTVELIKLGYAYAGLQRNERHCIRNYLVGHCSDILVVLVSLETKPIKYLKKRNDLLYVE